MENTVLVIYIAASLGYTVKCQLWLLLTFIAETKRSLPMLVHNETCLANFVKFTIRGSGLNVQKTYTWAHCKKSIHKPSVAIRGHPARGATQTQTTGYIPYTWPIFAWCSFIESGLIFGQGWDSISRLKTYTNVLCKGLLSSSSM